MLEEKGKHACIHLELVLFSLKSQQLPAILSITDFCIYSRCLLNNTSTHFSFSFEASVIDEFKYWLGWLKKEQEDLTDYGKHKILLILSRIWVAQ